MRSLKKLRASQISLLRYIEAQQAYELRVVWQSSQIGVPPTIRYIKDIFLAPYVSIMTDYLYDNEKSFGEQLNSRQVSQCSTKIAEQKVQKKIKQDEFCDPRKQKKKNEFSKQRLNYDLLMSRNQLIAAVIDRNKQIIKYCHLEDVLRKRKKIM